ncbi:MAG: DNA repair protein RecO, partial [Lachnospiraceae bacterium]|nr:DNA repair protein RecO [Lachnospiraceae bacterium]
MSDLLKLTGIVLLAAPAGEYDKRVVILTREYGKITAFAKGVRRQNSPLLAAASPFAFGEFSCYEGRGTYRLVQAEIQQYFREITEDYESAMYGFYFLELASYYSREGEGEPELLKLLYAALRAMIRRQQPRKLVRYVYELRVLVLNGEYPEPFHCASCGGTEHLNRFSLGRNGFLCENCAPGEGR